MKKQMRIKFQCYTKDCLGHTEPYTQYREVTPKENPRLLVKCPYCGLEGVVDLGEHRSTVEQIYQSSDEGNGLSLETIDFKQTFQTKPVPETSETTPHEESTEDL